ncbi:GH3 auxin-responsive promoter family protein [Ferruginibacter yonginensis]|uniref:GH3 auxin-responsive promoter family protein n=1 Tax=Ferruginibacter yonginensis TaxID=1310416 RepID=A0ABV8QUL6_9BACT
MNLLSKSISFLARLRYNRIHNWINHPAAAQRQVLQSLITDAQYTHFGKKYQFDKLFTIKEFKKRVPLHEYDDVRPYIEKMMAGEENILWNTPVKWFAKSSGTTNDKSKFIPVSEESLKDNHFKASKDVLTKYYTNFPSSNLLTGKSLVVGGSHQISQLSNEIATGDLSAILMQNSPFWGQWLRTPELSIALLDEWENKIEQLANVTANENVTMLAGVPTWTLLLLKRILEIKQKQTIKEVWPNLELYINGGVSFVPYRQQFEQIIGKPINYLEIYNASEGFIAGQEKPDDDGLMLFTEHGIFYEFLPVENYGQPNPQTLGLTAVQLHKNYAIVISTTGGLWRYIMGDTVEFTSLNPYKIKITGRLKHYMNAFGEEVIVDNADNAIAVAAQQTGAVVSDYTAAPIYFTEQSNGAHEWLIEFEKAPAQLDVFIEKMDTHLKSINSDYEAKRQKSIALRMPVVHAVPVGTFTAWLRTKGKVGGQHKVPRLSNERKIIDEIKQLVGIA